MNRKYCTLREAIEKFPNLLDEIVTWGSMNPSKEDFLESKEVAFQFYFAGGYRSRVVQQNDNT